MNGCSETGIPEHSTNSQIHVQIYHGIVKFSSMDFLIDATGFTAAFPFTSHVAQLVRSLDSVTAVTLVGITSLPAVLCTNSRKRKMERGRCPNCPDARVRQSSGGPLKHAVSRRLDGRACWPHVLCPSPRRCLRRLAEFLGARRVEVPRRFLNWLSWKAGSGYSDRDS